MSDSSLSRRRFLQGMGVATTGAVMAACVAPTAPQAGGDMAETAETPEIWVFQGQPNCPGGGNPEKTEAVRQRILDETGVLVQVYLVATGAAQTEKLNLLLASGTQPLDLFEGQWPEFKGIAMPLDDLLARLRPHRHRPGRALPARQGRQPDRQCRLRKQPRQ